MSNSFDEILENKIKFGKYQLIAMGILCLVDFNDGVELLSMSIILPIIKTEWNLSKLWVEVLSSIFYLGMFFGAILTGFISDTKGRRNTLIYTSIIQFLLSITFSVVNSIFSLVILRFLYGFCYGFSIPLSMSYISEVIPLKYRGKCMIIVNFCVSAGKVWGILLGYFVLDNLNSGNWRLMMVLCSTSFLIVIYGSIRFLKESPRFLLAIGKLDECVEVLNYIGEYNAGAEHYNPITKREIDDLQNYCKTIFNKNEQANPRILFSDKNFPITIRLWVLWFGLIFMEFGAYILLPFILINQAKGFGTLLMAIAGELPSIFFTLYMVDKKTMGRKNTLTLCTAMVGVLNLFTYMADKNYLGIILLFERFFMKDCFSCIAPLTSEMYNTNYRTIGYGYASSCGRLAATICPYILFQLFYYDPYSGFIVFGIIGFIASFASWTLPFDTTNKFLDSLVTSTHNDF